MVKLCVFACLLSGLSLPWAQRACGKPLIQQYDRVEVNWSTLRVRFFGMGKKQDPEEAYALTEKTALQDALTQMQASVKKHEPALAMGFGDMDHVVKQLARVAYIFHSEHFPDGSLRLHMEGALPKLITGSEGGRDARKIPSDALKQTRHTGVVFVCDRTIAPMARYKIVDETGGVLFAPHDIVGEAYQKNLMGRWFSGTAQNEWTSTIGINPLTLQAKVITPGVLEVSKADWEQASLTAFNQPLLAASKIAMVVP